MKIVAWAEFRGVPILLMDDGHTVKTTGVLEEIVFQFVLSLHVLCSSLLSLLMADYEPCFPFTVTKMIDQRLFDNTWGWA